MGIVGRVLNARLTDRVVPRIVLMALLGYGLAGILLAILVPPLHARGFPLRGWIVWSTILAMIAICIAPDLYRRYRRRRL